jgi:colanic acid biosynthesis protein WcaH
MPTSALPRSASQNLEHNHSFSAAPLLDAALFAAVVANAPLVSIDLIVEDQHGAVLLGLRNNPPAQDCWFVPGGRVRKNETLDQAFARISTEETGLSLTRSKARLIDVYEHFYNTDFAGTAGTSTHYVVLAYRVKAVRENLQLPALQHRRYLWMPYAQGARHPDVHPYSRAYFVESI